MGKSDEKEKRAHKANTDGDNSKHKNQTSLPLLLALDHYTTFNSSDAALRRHSRWCDLFRQMCEFKVQSGHCNVPERYSPNPKLGSWVHQQRFRYKLYTTGKSTTMTAEYIRALDGISFDWGVRRADWSVRFEQMREFKKQFGHCLVPQTYPADPKLGYWVKIQRSYYRLYQKGKPSPMTADRIRALDSIGFDCGASKADLEYIWSVRFQQMREFKVQFGHCLVPQQYSANPKLGHWVSKQRYHYKLYQEGKHSHMTAERIRELKSLGFY